MQGAEECRLRRINNTPQGETTEGNTADDSLMVDQGQASKGPFQHPYSLISQFYPSDPVPVFPIICSWPKYETKHGLFPKGESFGLYMEYGHGKADPRYAVLSYSSAQGTIGGIKINEPMEACDQQHVPMAGLYVLGNDAGGWNSDAYYIISCTGSALGFAINSGRIAAENAALCTSGKQAITG